jgi:hypothetical protein
VPETELPIVVTAEHEDSPGSSNDGRELVTARDLDD